MIQIEFEAISAPRFEDPEDCETFSRVVEMKLPYVSVVVMCAWDGIPDFSYEKNMANLALHQTVFDLISRSDMALTLFCFGSCAEYDGLIGEVDDWASGLPSDNPLANIKRRIFREFEKFPCVKTKKYWIVPFYLAGANQRRGSLFDHICRSLISGDRCTISASINCDFVHVLDLCDLLVSIVEQHLGTKGEIVRVNVGSGKLIDHHEIKDCVSEWAANSKLANFDVETVGDCIGKPSFYSSNRLRNSILSCDPRPLTQMLEDCFRSVLEE